jgi:uncharacterized protein YbgA (DUF1722 family)
VDFHSRNKLLLMAHSPKHLKQMGEIVARAGDLSPKQRIGQYERLLMEAMAIKPTPAKHVNVLHHMMGYFKKNLSAAEKQELLEVIDEYRRELIPLIVPVTLMSHYVRKYDEPYLKEQVYLNPHPLELRLRNHA